MTVKINKPALNLREELNELNKPSGITGESLLRADTDADARATLGIDNFEQVSVSTDGVISADGLALSDSDKATFGAGDDLQIYHDGSNSYVSDTGTGGLYLKGSNEIALRNASNENIFLGLTDGSAYVYHNGLVKLATTSTGIDVTGTATMDGLSVETGDTGNGINYGLDIRNSASGNSTSYAMPAVSWSNSGLRWASIHGERKSSGGFGGNLVFNTMNTSNSVTKRMDIDYNGDISFYEDTGTTPKLFWDASAESLGIGTSSPSSPLHINAGNTNQAAFFESTDVNVRIAFADSSTATNYPAIGAAGQDLFLKGGGSEQRHMTIDAAGNVGIGTSAPSHEIDLTKALTTIGQNPTIQVKNSWATEGNNTGFDNKAIGLFSAGADTVITKIQSRYDSGANVGQIGTQTNHDFLFTTNNTERMRLSGGNLLVGKTTTSSALITAGVDLRPEGRSFMTRSAGPALYLSRTSSDGNIAEFYKDGTSVGSIGAAYSEMYIGSGATGLYFNDTSKIIHTINTTTLSGSSTDGTVDLGYSGTRFKDLHLSGGVYLGGTGAANKLEDYEEGTFTPSLTFAGQNTGMVLGSVHGTYTKVGRMVTSNIRGTISTLGSSTGQLYLEGLPFTVGDTLPSTGLEAVGHVGFVSKVQVTTTNLNLIPSAGGTFARFPYTSSSYETEYLGSSNISNGFDFRATLTYFTA